MKYSPKLKTAMSEIKDILKKHDIAGVIVLHTPGNSEYLLKIDPSYSCAKLNGQGIHLKTTNMGLKDDEKKKLVNNTSNMLHLLGVTTGQQAMNIMDVSTFLDKKIGATHFGNDHTSQTELNN